MRRFERTPNGTLAAQLDAEEAVLLQSLAGQVAELVAESTLRQAQGVSTSSTRENDSTSSTRDNDSTSSTRDNDSTSSTRENDSTSSTRDDSTGSTGETDAAVARLLPDAYPDDTEASEEFRRFTQSGLVERKVGNAETVIRTLAGAGVTGSVDLDDAEALSWLRCLTDIRLTIASRLGIETEDDDAGRTIDPLMREIYDWLGFVQNSLIEALDSQASRG